MIKIKRAYDEPDDADGLRILVDRLWPRGMKKEAAAIDHWMREISPSNALRKWYDHDPKKWEEFQRRYAEELASHERAVQELVEYCRSSDVTLIYGAKNEDRNNAVALRAYLLERLG